jgi:hypothetical protein
MSDHDPRSTETNAERKATVHNQRIKYNVSLHLHHVSWLGYGLDVRGVVDRLLARVRNLYLLQSFKTGSGTHLANYSMGTKGSHRASSGQDMKLTTLPRLRMSSAISVSPTDFHVMHSDHFAYNSTLLKLYKHHDLKFYRSILISELCVLAAPFPFLPFLPVCPYSSPFKTQSVPSSKHFISVIKTNQFMM